MKIIALIASELGANSSYVAVLQLFRILVIFIFLPPIFLKILSKSGNLIKHSESKCITHTSPAFGNNIVRSYIEETPIINQPNSTTSLGVINNLLNLKNSMLCIIYNLIRLLHILRASLLKNKKIFVMLAVATVGGGTFYNLGITAGALSGGMLATAIYCVCKGKIQFPRKLTFFMQVFSGAYIGTGINKELLLTLTELIIPSSIMFVGIFVFVFSTAFLMHKIFKLDLVVCLLSSTPGGIQEMSFLSEDLGGDTPKIALMQTTRLMFVIILFPTMLKMILGIVS